MPDRSRRQPTTFLRAEWRELVMLNYELDAAVLHGRAPPGTELDSFEGRTFVSVVGFRFLRTRVRGIPVPFHRDFEEVNLRFYVRRRTLGERRRGVVFVRELVPRRAIAAVANWVYHESYSALPMRHEVRLPCADDPTGVARYEWRLAGCWEGLHAHFSGEPVVPSTDSEERFITEHYWGYAPGRRGGSLEYRVEHAPWRVWRASEAALECDVHALYGDDFAEALAGSPSSAFVAEGSPVCVLQARRI